MGSVLDATILHHVCIVLSLLWFLNSFDCCHPVAYFLSLIYLYLVWLSRLSLVYFCCCDRPVLFVLLMFVYNDLGGLICG